MKHTLTKFTVDHMLNVTGEDISIVNLFYGNENGFEIPIPITIPYDIMLDFIKMKNEEAYNYLKAIRSSISGDGPMHSKVFEIIDEEGFDLGPYALGFFNALGPELVNKHAKKIEETLPIHNIDDLMASFNAFHEMEAEYQIKMDEFKEVAEQALHELTLKYFPELFEKGAPYIEAYEELLDLTTLNFMGEIDKLMRDEQ